MDGSSEHEKLWPGPLGSSPLAASSSSPGHVPGFLAAPRQVNTCC